jgi:predicted oxidoreductase
MGVPERTFTRTFERYHEMVTRRQDEDFGKRQELLVPLDCPPYYALKFAPALLAVVGGLRVDAHMRVLDEARLPIGSLYAVGNTAGGRYGMDYPMLIPGNSHGTALTFGYLTGERLGIGDKGGTIDDTV